MKAFVTGGTGFVGSHLVEALRARGDSVVALARRPATHAALAALGATPLAADLGDTAALAAAVAGADVVYHVAGLTSGSDAELHAVNTAATAALLQLCSPATVQRFVYVSSQAALGPSPPGERLGEDAPCRPVTAYGRSKLAGEILVRARTDLSWCVVRPPSVYGPRDREFLQLFKAAAWGVAPVFGFGTQQLSLVYVRDLAEAIARAGRSPRAHQRVYHAAHPEVVTSGAVARAAGAALGRRVVLLPLPPVVAAPAVRAFAALAARAGRRTVVTPDKLAEFLAPAWLLDTARAQEELAWTPVTGIAQGFPATAAWYRGEGWLA